MSGQLALVPGDYNQDLQLDCADADLLSQAIATGSTDLTFDANVDGQVNLMDFESWITDLKGTLLGDANLDMTVDGTDFIRWNNNKFTSNAGLCEGDFNGDGINDGTDFLLWNANKFSTVEALVTVPEPTGCWLLGIFTCCQFRPKNSFKKRR